MSKQASLQDGLNQSKVHHVQKEKAQNGQINYNGNLKEIENKLQLCSSQEIRILHNNSKAIVKTDLSAKHEGFLYKPDSHIGNKLSSSPK